MTQRSESLRRWLEEREGEHLECKEAKTDFHFDKLLKYCAALANEGGGRIVLGVTDNPPRRIVGTRAFPEPERTAAQLTERLRIKVSSEEFSEPEGRVLVFHVPSRPPGMAIEVNGAYYMRAGDELRPMTQDQLRRIFAETVPDFSAEVCREAELGDLDPAAVQEFRQMWRKKAGIPALDHLSDEQLLRDAELVTPSGVTNAALILLGRPEAIRRWLPQAEVIFEYRNSESATEAHQREEFQRGFLTVLDQLWNLINLRNEVMSLQRGLFRREIPAFNEAVVREAILNALTHRDYRLSGSVMIRQYPRKLEVVSPGGFPEGVTPRNILWKHIARNRRMAEACQRCGLVERSGQGADRMFADSIREGKAIPDYSRSDDYQVWLTVRGDIQRPEFLRFLEDLGGEQVSRLSVEDLLALDLIEREEELWEELKPRLKPLLELGAIERVGRGRGVRYILSRKLYSYLGRSGTYTRQRGLDRETNKALLLTHIQRCGERGAPLGELLQVLPGLSRDQVRTLLRELRAEGHVRVEGVRRAGRWYPALRGPDKNPKPGVPDPKAT